MSEVELPLERCTGKYHWEREGERRENYMGDKSADTWEKRILGRRNDNCSNLEVRVNCFICLTHISRVPVTLLQFLS
jgi:hypothetical protein